MSRAWRGASAAALFLLAATGLSPAVPLPDAAGRARVGAATGGRITGETPGPTGGRPAAWQGGGIVAPRLSPDGERVAYADGGRIWIVDIFDRRPRRLTDLDTVEMHPVWARNGRSVVFVTWPDDGSGGHVREALVEGDGTIRQVTSRAGYYLFPAFSRGDLWIAVLRAPYPTLREARFGRTGPVRAPQGADAPAPIGLELFALPVRGVTLGDPEMLVGPVRAWTRPHFGRDPGRLFTWQGGEGLISSGIDGSDRRTHLLVTSARRVPGAQDEEVPAADEVMVNPRGGSLFIRDGGDLWLMPFPAVGGSPIEVSLAEPDGAPLPLERVASDAEFAAWSTGGTALTWSRGRTFFVHFVERDETLEMEVPRRR